MSNVCRPRTTKNQPQRGVSFVEVLMVTAVVTLVFGGLFNGIQSIIAVIADNRSQVTALTLTTDRLEMIRSLSYNEVGTDGGIPSGVIPQVSTTTLNKNQFVQRVLIEYVDDAADGIAASDDNGITTDYKNVTVTTSWGTGSSSKSVESVTTIVPRSIESDVGGGTLRVNVFDADVQPLPGADVRLVNTAATTTIDTSRVSNVDGAVLFGGAPAGPEYELFVSRPGYSSDQTYRATTTLPNPATLPVTVLEADITTMNFFIDEFSTLNMSFYTDRTINRFWEEFSSSAVLATSTGVVVVGDQVELEPDGGGGHVSSGEFVSLPYVPSSVEAWDSVSIDQDLPSNTSVRWFVYSSSSTAVAPIPDADLPGNGSGFVTNQIDISELSPTKYPNLVVRAELSTSDTSVTPEIDELFISYQTVSTPLSGEAVTLTSQKTIGTNTSFQPVPKHQYVETTDAGGRIQINDIEWDSYVLDVGTRRVTESCTTLPIPIPPGEVVEAELILQNTSTHTLRARVEAAGQPVANAAVTLSRSGFTETQYTSRCGEVFFNGVSTATDYSIEVDAPSYPLEVVSPVEVASTTVEVISL